jgi:Domain of unknown function (DUF3597)
MSLFNTILEKLGLGASAGVTPGGATGGSAIQAPTPATSQPTSKSPVDVTGQLDQLAARNQEKLNWKTSIVDLLKLLGIDSSLEARKKLATELGCPADKMSDSAQMNMWLHKTVLQKLADNGGNVPTELLNR